MFKQLSIKNFKAWKDTGEIRLAPITVFFGANSAGKTSLLQFLLLLRQSAESRDRKQVFHPGDETTDVDLGTFRDMVFQHDLTNRIDFSLEWTLPHSLRIVDPRKDQRYNGASIQFHAEVAAEGDSPKQVVNHFAYTLGAPDGGGLCVEMRREDSGNNYKVKAAPYKLVRNKGRGWALPGPSRFYGFPEEVLAYFQNAAFTSDLTLHFEQQLRRIKYLGPLRQRAKRTYVWSGETPEGVGFDGRFTIPALLASGGRMISTGYWKRKEPLVGFVGRWLKELGLLDKFDAKALSKASKHYEIVVASSGNRIRTNLPDVGFGVSQVLPVIVEAFYAEPNSTIVVEQPELHLHPRVQAHLANLFVEAIRSRQDGHDRNVQFLIESHSEHFVYRLQRLIAEERVTPDEVALYFCRPGPDGSIVEPLQLNEDGDILNWPDDFFGNEMEDVQLRLEAAAARATKGI